MRAMSACVRACQSRCISQCWEGGGGGSSIYVLCMSQSMCMSGETETMRETETAYVCQSQCV